MGGPGKPENLTRKGKGRPKGAKNRIPRDIRKLAEEIEREHGDAAKEAWLRGLKSRPPYSATYLELLLDRRLGRVAQPMDLKVSQPIQFFLREEDIPEAEDP